MTLKHVTDDAGLTHAGFAPPLSTAAWPEHYGDASQAIAAEVASAPHDPALYWTYFPGTD